MNEVRTERRNRMLRKAVEKSSVVPQPKPRFEKHEDDESIDPSSTEDGWVLNDQVLVARRFDVAPRKPRSS